MLDNFLTSASRDKIRKKIRKYPVFVYVKDIFERIFDPSEQYLEVFQSYEDISTKPIIT